MQLFALDVSERELDHIAEAMGIQVYNYRSDGRRRVRGKFKDLVKHEFTLRPAGSLNENHNDYRRPAMWAVSWAGHYVFMRVLLRLNPNAVIKSAMNEFHGFHDFDASAFATGRKNIGSMVQPMEYWDSQHREHIDWHTEADLMLLADQVLDEIELRLTGKVTR